MNKVNISNIATELWNMANKLRGTMDASEYKNYILAFIFYKYLSENQEKYLIDNHVVDYSSFDSLNDAYISEASGSDLEDYLIDITSSLGYAIEPNDTWVSLVNKINDKKIIPSDYQTMFDNFNKNADRNEEASRDFKGIFNDVNLADSRLGNSTNERTKSLNEIVLIIDKIDYKGENGKDILGDIYEILIGKFASNAGKKGGEFYTPHHVSQILAKLVTIDLKDSTDTISVYDPAMGSGSLLLTVGKELPYGEKVGAIKYYGQELNLTTYNLARMNLMMHNVSYNNMDLKNADSLALDWPDGIDKDGIDKPRSFDAVVANPPYSQEWDNDEKKLKDPRFSEYGKLAPKSKADYAFVLHSIYHLNNSGTMAIVLPHGVLFRGAAEGKIRETLITKNYIDAVIGLPANLFYGTSIATTILVFKKNKTNKDILFIDASNDFEKGKNQNSLNEEIINKILDTYKNRENIDKYAYVASIDEIKENDYNLNIPRYVDTFEAEEKINLGQVTKEIFELDKEIMESNKLISEMMKELIGTNKESQAELDEALELFSKNEV